MCSFPRDEVCKTVLIGIKGDSLGFQPQVITSFVVYCNTQSENIFLMCLRPLSSFRAVCWLVLFFSRPLHRVPDIFNRRNFKMGVTTSRATSGDRKNDPNTSGQRWNNFHTSYIDRSFVVSGNNRVVKPKCKQFTSLNKMISNSKVLIVHISFFLLL